MRFAATGNSVTPRALAGAMVGAAELAAAAGLTATTSAAAVAARQDRLRIPFIASPPVRWTPEETGTGPEVSMRSELVPGGGPQTLTAPGEDFPRRLSRRQRRGVDLGDVPARRQSLPAHLLP